MRYLFIIVFFILSCNSSVEKPNCDEIYLKDYSNVVIGVGDGTDYLSPFYEPFFVKHFDRITLATFFFGLLMEDIQNYKFEYVDSLVNYLHSKHIQIHAHSPLYALPSISPDFLVNFSGTKQEFEQVIKHYIQVVLGRYKGKVKSYDLFNELFDYNTSSSNPSWLRNKFDSDNEFFDFVARCYQYAHEADPDALLFYNDYGQEFSNNNYEKGRAIADLLIQWKNQGVPIHGYGLQLHTNIYRPLSDIKQAFEIAKETGLLIHVSELDISLNWADYDVYGVKVGEQGIVKFNKQHYLIQANYYYHIVKLYQQIIPEEQRFGITLWGFSDIDNWLSKQRFEAATIMFTPFQKKIAYWYFLKGLSDIEFDCY